MKIKCPNFPLLQTPASVRKDWAKNHKLPFFTSTAFQESLDRVCNYMGVSEPAKHNHANIALMEGARRLGYAHKVVPQNTGGPNHDCGHECANGCRHGQKKGGVHAWLVDAAKAGAVFMEQTYVSKVVLDERRRATGVVLRLVDGSEVEVKAGKVIISAGALHSAALLLRSGLQVSALYT
jgi:choline dehydrogenase-like flavoprotein